MSDEQENTPAKVVTPKKLVKLKNTTFKSKTKLQSLHESSPRNIKFKSPAGLKKPKQLELEEEGEVKKPKAKKRTVKASPAHSGVPPNPKMRAAFRGLKAKLESMKS